MTKAGLRQIGGAAIRATMTDQEVAADPARAFHIALASMRAALKASAAR